MEHFEIDKNILYSVIAKQAGTVQKAFLELVMNSIDAGASKVDIEFDGKRFSVLDDGKGFESEDKKFAMHPNDEERAIELLGKCVKENVSLQELLAEVEHYLKSSLDFDNQPSDKKEHMQKYIGKELQKVKVRFKEWLK